jgi:UDP-N-acetylmuramate--alanine ligase
MTLTEVRLLSKEELMLQIPQINAPVLVTIGAGDIGEMVPEIKKIWE